MTNGYSRRQLVATLGVASTTLAGCLDALPIDEMSESGAEQTNGTDEEIPDDAEPIWPAIGDGEAISAFESVDRWEPVTGEIEPVPEEARFGTQAMAVESESNSAAARIRFPDGLDLEGWDTSLAVKMESATRIHVELMAPERGSHLTSIRPAPDGYDGWLRFDFGYIQKHDEEGEPDLSDVRQLNVIAIGPDDGPTRVVMDDLRRTESIDNGKAILALYGGRDSHYEIAAPMLEERDWAAATPVDPGRIGASGRMDVDELRELRDRDWDVCSYPRVDYPLSEQPESRQRQIIETAKDGLEERGFSDGARHFFVPDDRMNETTHDLLREHHDSSFLFGSSPTGAPPTGIHMTPLIWGPDLYGGVRRAINLCDQYDQLVTLRIPRIVADEADVDANSMSAADFEHLLDHIANRGLDVITPSELVDGTAPAE